MNLARVIGRVVATRRSDGLAGRALLVIQPLNESLEEKGASLVAADAIGSGPGEIVFFVGGREASLALSERFVPVDAAIVGHVEEVAVRGLRVEPPAAGGGA